MKKQTLKSLKNRSGVSHILSNVLMLLVIIIASSVAFSYVANYVGDYQSGRGAVLLQRLLFEDVWFKDDQIIITIYNYGKSGCNVTSVFIDSHQYSIADPPVGYVIIPVEEHRTIKVNFVWTSGSAHNLKLLTERGYTVERDYEAP
jgi:hypothetical protein